MPTAHKLILTSATKNLRELSMTWAIAAFLPLPILVATDPTGSADVSCLYLGVFCAWLATEIFRLGGLPQSREAWCAKALAVSIAVAVNVALFALFGLAAGVQTHFPFPLMATLSAIPAIGMIPWLLRRTGQPFAAIILAGCIVFACKLFGCIIARFAYGSDHIAQGYVSADWRTAKLMISMLWILSTSLSLVLLVADYRWHRKSVPIDVVVEERPAMS